MVPIPYGVSYRTTVTGQIPKLVKCQQCGMEYVYLLEASAAGEGTSLLFLDNEGAQQRSRSEAEAQLFATLETDCDVVPCPACGHVQEHMVPKARSLRRSWMNKAALTLFIVTGISFLPTMIVTLIQEEVSTWLLALWAAVALIGGTAAGLPIVKFLLSRTYDPNSEPVEDRKRAGKEFAYSKDEFLKGQQGAPS